MTQLVSRKHGPLGLNAVIHDSVFELGGIDINQDAYTSGLDRIYDVRGFNNMHIEVENTGAVNGLTYKVEKARIDFNVLDDLADTDFNVDLLADTNVAAMSFNTQDVVDISPETTAVRIRLRRQTSGQDTTAAGIVSVN